LSKALSTRRSTGPGQRGWISSKWGVTETGRRAKFYTLTKAGSKQLKTTARVSKKVWTPRLHTHATSAF